MNKIYDILRKAGITPNGAFVLWSIREQLGSIGINIPMEMRGLTPIWLDDGKLTAKAYSLLIEIDEFFIEKKVKNDKDLMGTDFKSKIEEYRLIFPEGKLPSGKYARDSVKNLESCFKWFFKNHEHDWDLILTATKKYCIEHEAPNDKYHRTSKYFIVKSDGGTKSSDLATYCENVLSGTEDKDNFHFKEPVV